MHEWAVIRPVLPKYVEECSCGNAELMTELTNDGHRVICEKCGRKGQRTQSRLECCALWNEMRKKEEAEHESERRAVNNPNGRSGADGAV